MKLEDFKVGHRILLKTTRTGVFETIVKEISPQGNVKTNSGWYTRDRYCWWDLVEDLGEYNEPEVSFHCGDPNARMEKQIKEDLEEC